MLSKFGEVFENISLENYNTYGIKTKTKYLVKPDSIDNLKKLINYLKENSISYYILGGGSNVILPDKPYEGVIITLERLNHLKFNENIVEVEAGINLGTFINKCINNSLGGLEYLALIPGSLGGALYGNAGVGKNCIYDYLEDITILKDNELITLKKSEVEYSYRHTCFKNSGVVIVSATFKLYYDDILKLKDIVKENRIKRLNSQPLEYKNAGSVFKNPEDDYAGRLIESLGLKGYTIGGAQISEKHANFIINVGDCSGEDIRALIKSVKAKVFNVYHIELELEQIIIEWE